MVVDASAIIAILRAEPERATFISKLRGSQSNKISCATYVELCIVQGGDRKKSELWRMDEILEDMDIRQVPFDEEQAQAARTAWLQYGKGGHPAKLNLGDCFSYALAKVTGEPLLFKGNDFSKTDIKRA
jgi:ribonuclease VapC